MDDIYEHAERMIAEADSPATVRRAVVAFLQDMFSSRPATLAYMAKVLVVTLDRVDGVEAKRQAALMFIHSIRSEVSLLAKARAERRSG